MKLVNIKSVNKETKELVLSINKYAYFYIRKCIRQEIYLNKGVQIFSPSQQSKVDNIIGMLSIIYVLCRNQMCILRNSFFQSISKNPACLKEYREILQKMNFITSNSITFTDKLVFNSKEPKFKTNINYAISPTSYIIALLETNIENKEQYPDWIDFELKNIDEDLIEFIEHPVEENTRRLEEQKLNTTYLETAPGYGLFEQ